jgi:hypothetical protein
LGVNTEPERRGGKPTVNRVLPDFENHFAHCEMNLGRENQASRQTTLHFGDDDFGFGNLHGEPRGWEPAAI